MNNNNISFKAINIIINFIILLAYAPENLANTSVNKNSLPVVNINEYSKQVESIIASETINGNKIYVKASYYTSDTVESFIYNSSEDTIKLSLKFILLTPLYSGSISDNYISKNMKENIVIDNNINKINVKYLTFYSDTVRLPSKSSIYGQFIETLNEINPSFETDLYRSIMKDEDYGKITESINLDFTFKDFKKMIEGNSIYIQIYKDLYYLNISQVESLRLFYAEVEKINKM